MLNLHPNIICPSEEPFALYFYNKYKNKVKWTEYEISNFVDEFWLMAEQSLELCFTSKEKLYEALIPLKNELNYKLLCNVIYLQFIEPKPKNEISTIVDKQIKYFFYLKKLIRIFPESKFIILVRDPKVNAISKKNRHLNISENPLYLAALWKNTYTNIEYLQSKNKSLLIVKYEDLVSNPELILKNICEFIGMPYVDKIIQTEGVFESFIDEQKHRLTDEKYNDLSNFHSSLYEKINKEKIHLQENEMNELMHDKIVKLTLPLLKKFNYETKQISQSTIVFNINDRWQILKAYLYRPLLFQFYFLIPLSIKLFIKRIKA